MIIVKHGLYAISDTYFSDFPSEHWMQNKSESRPHYYSFEDPSGFMWMIPLSTKVDNYRRKLEREEARRGKGNCVFYHIGKIAGYDRVFIISDMFPIDSRYIVRPFQINSVDYVIRNDALNSAVRSKAARYIRLIEQYKIVDRNNILSIRAALLRSKTK